MDDANDVLLKVEESTFEMHWDSHKRKRDFESIINRLRANGRKCGGLVGVAESTQLGQQCFDVADTLEERQALIDDIRSGSLSLGLQPLEGKRAAIFKRATSAMIGNVVTFLVGKFLDQINEPGYPAAILRLLAGKVSESSATMNINLATARLNQKSYVNVQRSGCLQLCEGVLKLTCRKAYSTIAKALVER